MKKITLSILKATAISLLIFISLILQVSATITIQAPQTVKLQEQFTVNINADIEGHQDVKIYLINESKSIISEIQGTDWMNGRYYVNDAYPTKKAFLIRAKTQSQNTLLCAKLRLSEKRNSKPPTLESCISIKIVKEDISNESLMGEKININSPQEEISQNKSSLKKPASIKASSPEKIVAPDSAQNFSVPEEEEIMALNNPQINSKIILSSQEKTRICMMVVFFIIVLGILFWILRKEKKKREQENI